MSESKKDEKKVEKKPVLTNAMFAQKNEQFKYACESVNIKITTRQASKWRMHKGLAYTKGERMQEKKEEPELSAKIHAQVAQKEQEDVQ